MNSKLLSSYFTFDYGSLDEAAACFAKSGFVVIRQILPQDEVEKMQSEICSYIHDVVPTKSERNAFYDGGMNKPETLKFLGDMTETEYWRNVRSGRFVRTDYSPHIPHDATAGLFPPSMDPVGEQTAR
jgi:hypothetical protein